MLHFTSCISCAEDEDEGKDDNDIVQLYSIPSGLLNGILFTGSGDGVAGESLDGV